MYQNRVSTAMQDFLYLTSSIRSDSKALYFLDLLTFTITVDTVAAIFEIL